MKRSLIITLTLLLALSSVAVARMNPVMLGGRGNIAVNDMIETFDTALGYDLSWTPTETPNPDYTPAIVGVESLHTDAGDGISISSPVVSGDFIIQKIATLKDTSLVFFKNESGTTIAGINLRSTGSFRIYQGTAVYTGGTHSLGVPVHLWWEFTPSSGGLSNGKMKLYYAAYTGSETKDGSPYIQTAVGTSEDTISIHSYGGVDIIFDNINLSR